MIRNTIWFARFVDNTARPRNDPSSMLKTNVRVMASLLVVVVAGCNPSSEKVPGSTRSAIAESSCRTVAEHLASLAIANTDKPGIRFVEPEAGPVILRVVASRCDQDRWSGDAKACYLAMKDTNGWQVCDAKLTGEQLAKIRAELDAGEAAGRTNGNGSSIGSSGTGGIVEPAVTPVVMDPSAPWIESADKALRLMLDGHNRSIVAASIQNITHPFGSKPRLKSYDVRRMGDRISVRISVNWEGSVVQDAHGNGKIYATDVVWEFSEHGHVSAKVLSDSSLWGPDGAQRLDDWFRNELYPVLYRNTGR